MVCDAFNFLDTCRTGFVKRKIDVTQTSKQRMVEILELRERKLAQRNKIFDLHTYTVTYESILRKIVCKPFGLASVSAVYRRDGSK